MLLKIKKKFKFNIINKNQSIKKCLWQLNKSKYKCLIVCDNQRNKVIGTLSDGDIRRALIGKKTLNTKIGSIVKKHFIYFDEKTYSRVVATLIFPNCFKFQWFNVLKYSSCDQFLQSQSQLLFLQKPNPN